MAPEIMLISSRHSQVAAASGGEMRGTSSSGGPPARRESQAAVGKAQRNSNMPLYLPFIEAKAEDRPSVG